MALLKSLGCFPTGRTETQGTEHREESSQLSTDPAGGVLRLSAGDPEGFSEHSLLSTPLLQAPTKEEGNINGNEGALGFGFPGLSETLSGAHHSLVIPISQIGKPAHAS